MYTKYPYAYSNLYLACAIATLTMSVKAEAQSLGTNVDEVIVTAQMRNENAQSVPIAIGTYDKKFISTIGAKSLTDMEFSIPNINFGSGGRNTRGEIAIRGISDYSRNIGSGTRVAVYVDGILTGRSFNVDQGLLDIDRIELLRGPQGTLAGTNAEAGSINIITQKPTNELGGSLLVETGNFNEKSVTGKINAPLSSELLASLAINKTQKDGHIYNKTLDRDLQGTDNSVANLKFRYVGIEDLTLDIGFNYLHDDNKSTNAEALADGSSNGFKNAPAPYEVAHNVDEFSRRQFKGATITAHYLTEKQFNLVSMTGISSSKFKERNEEDYSPRDIASSLFDEENDQISQEFRLVSPKSETFDYVLGSYFLNQDLSTQRSANAGALFPVPKGFVITPATAENNSSSVFMHGNYYFATNWEINGGVRYIHENKTIDYSSEDRIGSFINVSQLRDKKTYNELLPKIGLNYHPTQNTLLYSSISRGYKSGGWNADFISTLENFQFNPEYAQNYELGLKSILLDGKVTLNTSGFSTHFSDFQIFQFVKTQTGNTIISYTNAGKASTQGIEIDLTIRPIESLKFTINSALTQAKFDEFKDGGGIGKDFDNNDLPYAPEKSHYFAIDYNKNITQSVYFYSHIDYSHTGSYFSNPNNSVDNTIKSHNTSNMRLGLTIDNLWDVSVWIKNMTNEKNLRQRSVSFLGVPRGYYDPPRTYGLTLSYTFK